MFATVEIGIKLAIKEALGQKIKEVATHPGRWGEAVIKKMLRAAPAVYVGFSQGSFKELGTNNINAVWYIYVTATTLNARRELGAYQMMEQVIVALHDLDLDQTDALRFKQVKNLFSFAQADQGFSCYELIFELPIAFPSAQSITDLSTIDDWQDSVAKHYDCADETHLMAEDHIEFKPET